MLFTTIVNYNREMCFFLLQARAEGGPVCDLCKDIVNGIKLAHVNVR